jgi:hypothetical protein
MTKNTNLNTRNREYEAEGAGNELEAWVPLSVREARRARERRDDLWPYVWVNFVAMILLFSALAIACYRAGAPSCLNQ